MKHAGLLTGTIAIMLAFLTSGCVTRTTYIDLYGREIPPAAWVDRTIVLTPATRYINVEGGQSVRFIVGDKAFAWHFIVARTVNAFDLKEVAPAGLLDHTVMAYVSPDPKYLSVP